MNPIRRAGVVAFFEWIRRNQPTVNSLKSLSKTEFLELATKFERSKGLEIDESHEVYRKWESTHWTFSRYSSDKEAFERLR